MSIAVASDEIATESVHARLAGDDVDDASRCIASIEAALRALQDFDALDIGQAVDHRTIDLRYIVDKGSDTRIGAEEDGIADAADVWRDEAEVRVGDIAWRRRLQAGHFRNRTEGRRVGKRCVRYVNAWRAEYPEKT